MSLKYKIIRSKRRSISIEINRDAELIVRAPFLVTDYRVELFLEEKEKWITNKLEIAKKRLSETTGNNYESGEEYLFLGDNYFLSIVSGMKEKILFSDRIYISEKYATKAKNIISKWYKDKARELFTTRLDKFSEVMNLQYSSLRLSSAKSRWGSMSPTGNINLNWKLIMAPIDVIDYVVIHELAHLRHPNHSKKFWGFVEEYDPRYKENRRWLKDNGHLLKM